MTGNGYDDAYYRPKLPRKRRLTVEQLADGALNINELNRRGLLKEDWITVEPKGLRWPRIALIHASRYGVELQLRQQVVPQYVRIGWTGCNYGGARPWFECPSCRKCVATLYKAFAGYLCRHCCNGIYESQRRSKKARAYLQAFRIRQFRLGGTHPVKDEIPPRPRGMRRKTYARLCARIMQLERKLIGSRVARHAPQYSPPLTRYS